MNELIGILMQFAPESVQKIIKQIDEVDREKESLTRVKRELMRDLRGTANSHADKRADTLLASRSFCNQVEKGIK